MCEEAHFSKFEGLQPYSWQLYDQINSFASISRQHFKSLPCSPMYLLKPPPPHQILKSTPPPHPTSPLCSQSLWETLLSDPLLKHNST